MQKRSVIKEAVQNVIQEHMFQCVLLFGCMAGALIFTLLSPLCLERIIDHLTQKDGRIMIPAMLWITFTILSCLFEMFREGLINRFGQHTAHVIRTNLSRKLERLPVHYFDTHTSGEITSLFVNDTNTTEKLFTSGIISMITDAAGIIGILVVIFTRSKGLFCLLLMTLPLVFLFTRYYQKHMLKAQKDNRVAVAKSTSWIPETVRNLRTINVFHSESYMEETYDSSIEEGYRSMNRSNFFDASYSPVIFVTSSAIISMMMVLCAGNETIQAWFGMSVGTAVALISYVSSIFSPLESLGMEIQNIQEAAAGIGRLNHFLQEDEREEGKESLERKAPAINVKDVSFGYIEGNPVLKHCSLTIQEGETVMIVGRTGSGKSTLIKLIQGLYRPQNGEVTVFGVPAVFLSEEQRRQIFGVVEQKTALVEGTVRDQITLRNPMITDCMVRNALAVTGMDSYVEKLEKGLDTICDRSMFSQGQMQLLSISRAIVLNPKILVLDEMTANVDSNTEQQVMEALKKVSRNRTVISISHRITEIEGSRTIHIEPVYQKEEIKWS